MISGGLLLANWIDSAPSRNRTFDRVAVPVTGSLRNRF